MNKWLRNYRNHLIILVRRAGIEPTTNGLKVRIIIHDTVKNLQLTIINIIACQNIRLNNLRKSNDIECYFYLFLKICSNLMLARGFDVKISFSINKNNLFNLH